MDRMSKKSGEEIPQILPCFKTHARGPRWSRDTLGNDRIVAVASEGLETERVDFGAPEVKSGRHVQAKEMATMRPERSARPTPRLQHFEELQVTGQPVAMNGIEEEDISVAAQPAVPVEQVGLCGGK